MDLQKSISTLKNISTNHFFQQHIADQHYLCIVFMKCTHACKEHRGNHARKRAHIKRVHMLLVIVWGIFYVRFQHETAIKM